MKVKQQKLIMDHVIEMQTDVIENALVPDLSEVAANSKRGRNTKREYANNLDGKPETQTQQL